jgi:hypothetical protein
MVCNSDGGGETRLAERKLPFYFDYPAWSPDGNVGALRRHSDTLRESTEFFDPQQEDQQRGLFEGVGLSIGFSG